MNEMNVGQLKAILAQYDDDDVVILSRDSEGNGFRSMSEKEEHSVGDGLWKDGELMSGNDEDEEPSDYEDAKKAVVLWPS